MEAQYAAAYPELHRRHWWWRVREKILLGKIHGLLANKPTARILDVGCGAGLFFDALQRFGHVEGIESDRRAVDGSGKWRSHITLGELDDSFQPTAPFDLILMLDVLEHIRQPDPLLQRASAMLTPSGRILLTVPAFNWLWTAHDQLNHHVTRYTAADMRRTIRRTGLVTIESGYLFQTLILPKLLVKAKEALTSRSPHVPSIPPRVFNSAAQAWFRAEHAAIGWLPFGGTLLAVAAHPASAERRSR